MSTCSKCGAAVARWANKCPACGTVRLDLDMPQQSLLPPRSHLWVALAAFCGCPPFGVPAIVYAILAEVKQREGQREEAFILADRAWYWIRLAAVSILVLLALLGTWLLRRS